MSDKNKNVEKTAKRGGQVDDSVRCNTYGNEIKAPIYRDGFPFCKNCSESETFCRGCGKWLTNEYYIQEEYCSDCI